MNKKASTRGLGWSERFALIKRYNPSESVICSTFGVSTDELHTAQELQAAGSFDGLVDVNVEDYVGLFPADSAPTQTKASSVTTHSNPKTTKSAPPASASKTVKKRGRQGTNIVDAFLAVPSTPTPVDAFAKANNVSLPVLRQSKRFDQSGLTGSVKVKKDKETKVLMIWREAPAEES